MNTLLKIEQVIGLVQLGLSSGKAIVDAVKAGRMRVQDAGGREMSADEVRSHVATAQAAALHTGDAAEGRIERRHEGEG